MLHVTDSPSRDILGLLQKYESQNITLIAPDGSWPIVWDRAQDVLVWDTNGQEYLDLTAAFGVAAAGHGNTRVVSAGQRQMTRLLHAMGDVHPHAPKAALMRLLSQLTFERWSESSDPSTGIQGKTILCSAGFEAVEAALKTAMLATGRSGVIAFEGAYHGLGYGALNVTHRDHFRSHFRSQLSDFSHFVPFPVITSELDIVAATIRRLLATGTIGALLVEPIQGRAGVRVPPDNFLPMIRSLCAEFSAILIIDEIYTGFGRTGKWFACEHSGTIPDLICLGKGLTGGFPLSACVGRADLMDRAWPQATGDPIHTSTFLGHPVGCAMAIAQVEEIRARGLVQRSAELGRYFQNKLSLLQPPSSYELQSRGVGLMAGLQLSFTNGAPATEATLQIVQRMLRRGFILLPDGEHSNVISFTPPLTITKSQLDRTAETLAEVIADECKSIP